MFYINNKLSNKHQQHGINSSILIPKSNGTVQKRFLSPYCVYLVLTQFLVYIDT